MTTPDNTYSGVTLALMLFCFGWCLVLNLPVEALAAAVLSFIALDAGREGQP